MTSRDDDPAPYRILIAVGDPDQWTILLEVAVPLARARRGRVLPLCVTSGESRPTFLTVPPEEQDVVSEPEVVRSRDISGAILDAVRRLEPDLLLLHWKGTPARGRHLLGRTLDPLIQDAACDVAVVRTSDDAAAFAERMGRLRRVLVPSGGGPNASLALRMAIEIGSETEVTALRVAGSRMGPTAVSAQWDILDGLLEPWPPGQRQRLRPHVALTSGSIVDGILEEAAHGYNLLLIGATRESLVDRMLFGNLPQQLALQADLPLIIVRRRDPLPSRAMRWARWRLVRALPELTGDERVTIYRQVRRNARADVDYYVMTALSAAIASLGLLLNSPAVVIGAMIMAPLMAGLVGWALGMVQGDPWLIRLSLRTTLLGVSLALGISIAVGALMPYRVATAEMLARGSPTLLDLGVAMLSGAAAAYAIARKDVASALPGVAVAVALVPPLATFGLAIVFADRDTAGGALLLFLTNLVAIVSSASIVFIWLGFRPGTGEELRARTFRHGLYATAAMLLVIAAILAVMTTTSIRHATTHKAVSLALDHNLPLLGPKVEIDAWDVTGDRDLMIEITVRSGHELTEEQALALQEGLARSLRRPVSLSLTVISTARLDLVAPPP